MKRKIKENYEDGLIGFGEAIRRLVEQCGMSREAALDYLTAVVGIASDGN